MRNQSFLILGASLGMAMGPSLAEGIYPHSSPPPRNVTMALVSGQDMSTQVTLKATVLPACTFTTGGTLNQTLDFGELSKLGSPGGSQAPATIGAVGYRCSTNFSYQVRISDSNGRMSEGPTGEFITPLKNQQGFALPAYIKYAQSMGERTPMDANRDMRGGVVDNSISFKGRLDPLAVTMAPPGQYIGSFTVTISPLGFSEEAVKYFGEDKSASFQTL
jgi:hypothetical protein